MQTTSISFTKLKTIKLSEVDETEVSALKAKLFEDKLLKTKLFEQSKAKPSLVETENGTLV